MAKRTITLFVLGCCFLASLARGSDFNKARSDCVGWARLQTPSEYWRRHTRGDPALAQFLRENTSLNIDPTWYAANVENLKELCRFPLLFSQGIGMLTSASAKANLAEYIRRGGFLFIDSCINRGITPDPDRFLAAQVGLLSEILPEARVVALPSSHDIYRCYFVIPGGIPPHMFDSDIYDARWARHGLYGVMIGSRMAGLISLSGLQCGWDKMTNSPELPEECMRMVTNIYIYAMLQGN